MRRAAVSVILACGLVASLTAGCSGPKTRAIPVAQGVNIEVPPNVSVLNVKATPAPNADASLVSTFDLPDGTSSPSPFVALATPVHLVLNGRFPTNGVDLTFHIDTSRVQDGTSPFIANFDPSAHEWIPVRTTFDPTTGMALAHITHFSLWGVFGLVSSIVKTVIHDVVNSLIGSIKTTDPAPTCVNPFGLSISMAPPAGDLETCANSAGNASATLKVKTLLAFPIDIVPPNETQIAVWPPGAVLSQIGGWLIKTASNQTSRTLISAGSEADLTFPLAAGASVKVSTELDVTAYLASVIDSGVSVLTLIAKRLGSTAQVTFKSLAQGKCASELVQAVDSTHGLNLSALRGLTQVGVDCATTAIKLDAVGFFQAIVSTISGLLEDVIQGGFGLVLSTVGGAATTITVSRSVSASVIPVDINDTPLPPQALQLANEVLQDAQTHNQSDIDRLFSQSSGTFGDASSLNAILDSPGAYDQLVQLLTETHGEPTDGFTWPGFTLDGPGSALTQDQQHDMQVLGVQSLGTYTGLRVLIHESFPDQLWGFGGILTTPPQSSVALPAQCPVYTPQSEFQAASCLLGDVQSGNRQAAAQVAESKVVDFLFANPPGAGAAIECMVGGICDLTWSTGCYTLYMTSGQMDVTFYEAQDILDRCD